MPSKFTREEVAEEFCSWEQGWPEQLFEWYARGHGGRDTIERRGRRGSMCRRGHDLARDGYSDKNGHRRCKRCRQHVDKARRWPGKAPRSLANDG